MKSVKLELLVSLNPKEMISIAIVYIPFIRKSSVRRGSSAVQTLLLISVRSCYESVLPLGCINSKRNSRHQHHRWILGYV